jgi:hypothetical protein
MAIRKAERKKAKLRLGIAAPSGAGKTYGALLLSKGLGGRIGLIDTENGSGDLYADLCDYDIISVSPPFEVAKYIEAIKEFEAAGYDTIIIDSLTHAWSGQGGLLEKQGRLADRGENGFSAWRKITPEHNRLVDTMLNSRAHVIATMRAKQEYVLESNEKGKQTPRKVGLAPVQRDGMEYEFTVMLDIDMNHVASASKDRTRLFDGRLFSISPATGAALRDWLEQGSAADEPPKPVTIDAKTVADHCANIEACESLEELFDAYRSAYLAATAVQDRFAMDEFSKAKDKKKHQIESQNTDAKESVE